MTKGEVGEVEINNDTDKVKKSGKRTLEEKRKDRRSILFVLILALVAVMFFWVNSVFSGRNSFRNNKINGDGGKGGSSFFVKYEI